MITSNLAEFSCPLPENKAGEFFGVSKVSNSTLRIVQKFSRAIGRAAEEVKSSEDLANLKDMIHRICDKNDGLRNKYLSDLKLSSDSQKSELPEIMAVLITKSKEPLELINEKSQEIQTEIGNFLGEKGENEKIILKNFTVRLTLNWLEKIKEKQQEINQEQETSQVEDLSNSFNFMTIEESKIAMDPSTSVKRRYSDDHVSRPVDEKEVKLPKKSRGDSR